MDHFGGRELEMLEIVLCALIAYLVGSFNPSYLFAKRKGFDIKRRGSGNAGASNAIITMGKKVGIVCAVLDILKAYAVVEITALVLPENKLAMVVAGVSCVMGHIFSLFLKFKGGKGLASLGGLILAYNPMVFLILLAVELVIVLIVDYICIVPITASVAFPIIYMSMTHDKLGALLYGLMAPIILYKHIENLKRIRNGTEAHFSYLWRKNKEIERLGVDPKDVIR